MNGIRKTAETEKLARNLQGSMCVGGRGGEHRWVNYKRKIYKQIQNMTLFLYCRILQSHSVIFSLGEKKVLPFK